MIKLVELVFELVNQPNLESTGALKNEKAKSRKLLIPNFNLKNDITKGKEGLLPKDNIELQCSFIILVMCMY